MEKARNDELYRALKEKDYPDDFCREIAYNQIRTDYTATRMLGYLYRTSNPRAEDVVDEMLAIFSDRDGCSFFLFSSFLVCSLFFAVLAGTYVKMLLEYFTEVFRITESCHFCYFCYAMCVLFQ